MNDPELMAVVEALLDACDGGAAGLDEPLKSVVERARCAYMNAKNPAKKPTAKSPIDDAINWALDSLPGDYELRISVQCGSVGASLWSAGRPVPYDWAVPPGVVGDLVAAVEEAKRLEGDACRRNQTA